MTRTELKTRLKRLGINPRAVSVGVLRDEAYVLVTDGVEWMVFYAERGERTEVRRHREEAAAVADLYRRVLRDPTTRLSALRRSR